MVNRKWLKIAEQCFLALFPNPRAYMNFTCTLVFLTIMISHPHEVLVVLVSGLATIYCFNEWTKQIEK